jgi:hypothetical protein
MPRARFGTTDHPCRESVVIGTNARLRSNFSGNQLWQGTFNTARTALPGELMIVPGDLIVTLT